MLTIYTTPGCVQCTATKRRLDKLNIAYVERVATDEIREQFKTAPYNFKSFPVVVPDQGEPWCGFRPDQIDALTPRKGYTLASEGRDGSPIVILEASWDTI